LIVCIINISVSSFDAAVERLRDGIPDIVQDFDFYDFENF